MSYCYDWNSTEWYDSPPAPPLTPGSTDTDHEQTNAQWVILGVVLCEVAVVMIALGSDLQRYALTMVAPERRCGPFSCSNTLWFVGLIIYFSGNGVFVAALGLAPASLCAALIATVVVANALISRVLLKETLARCDYHGGALIMAGIALTAAFAPYTSVEYTAAAIDDLVAHPVGKAYLGVLCTFCLLVMLLVLYQEHRERQQERQDKAAAAAAGKGKGENGPSSTTTSTDGEEARLPPPPELTAGVHLPPSPELATMEVAVVLAPEAIAGEGTTEEGKEGKKAKEAVPWLEAMMPFCYPVVIGTLETLVQMCMKGGSSMLYLTLFPPYKSQLCHATFWLVILAWALISVLVIFWLRKGLERLPASRLLPVEYGTVTATSVLGGLMLYQEATTVSVFNLAMMGVGIGLICGGCALVGKRKTMPKRYMPNQIVAQRCIPLLRNRVRRHKSPRQHQQLRELEVGRLRESQPTSPTPPGVATADAPPRPESGAGQSRPSLVARSTVPTGADDRTSRPTFSSHAPADRLESGDRSPQAAETLGRIRSSPKLGAQAAAGLQAQVQEMKV